MNFNSKDKTKEKYTRLRLKIYAKFMDKCNNNRNASDS